MPDGAAVGPVDPSAPVDAVPGRGAIRGFLSLVHEKAAEDNIFFLASGLTFSVLLAAIPFLLLLLAVAGHVLAPQFEAPRSEVLTWFWQLVPVADPSVRSELERGVQQVADQAGSIGLFGGVAFVWFSTRLFGALRTVLSEVFDLRGGPGVVRGKIMDVGLVLLSTVLLCGNVALTSVLAAVGRGGLRALGLEAGVPQQALGLAVAFLFIYLMFLLIYKFVSLNRIPWRSAALAALVASAGFEVLKAGFTWWVVNYVDYGSYFFAFATLVVVVIAVYYGSAIFVLGGEVAQVVDLRRTLRRQREMFEA